MKDLLQISDFRASLFMPQIPYNNKTLQEILPMFGGFVPSIVQPTLELAENQQPRIVNTPNSQWTLISEDRKIEIVFNENKVDVLLHGKQQYSVELLKALSIQAYEILAKLVGKFGHMSSRLAIAPTLSIEGIPEDKIASFTCSKFTNSKFKDCEMSNASFTNVYRVIEKICDTNYVNNYNIKIKTLNSLNIENNIIKIVNSLVCELDINTFPDPQYRFDIKKIEAFYSQSPDWTNTFVDYYFE